MDHSYWLSKNLVKMFLIGREDTLCRWLWLTANVKRYSWTSLPGARRVRFLSHLSPQIKKSTLDHWLLFVLLLLKPPSSGNKYRKNLHRSLSLLTSIKFDTWLTLENEICQCRLTLFSQIDSQQLLCQYQLCWHLSNEPHPAIVVCVHCSHARKRVYRSVLFFQFHTERKS